MKIENEEQNNNQVIRKIDIIVPVYNEGKNVKNLVTRIDKTMTKAKLAYTLLFIDDKSTDDTVQEIKKLYKEYPLKLFTKKGQKGKTFSILEGFEKCKADYVIMIDGDLQYPPEAIPFMVEVAQKDPGVGVVIANRKTYEGELFRRLGSRINAYIFGRLLLGLDHDVQSGLKLIKKEIVSFVDTSNMTQWTFDMPLLRTAKDLGYQIDEVDIDFAHRKNGDSKISFVKTAFDIASGALKLKIKHHAYAIAPMSKNTMHGSGILHKNKQYLTHTTLPYEQSAHKTLWHWQKAFIFLMTAVFITGMVLNFKLTAAIFMAILTTIYFLDIFLTAYLVLKSLQFPPEMSETQKDLDSINEAELPVYTILCPLFKEAAVLPQFLEHIQLLDWPKDKLDVILLLEEVDEETINKAAEMKLSNYVRTVIVPHSNPQTKPKACNYGLSLAKGEYVVIYDAEDKPDPMQLKKAYLGFNKSAPNVACLQAKLNYYNPHHNILTRLFTTEYSLWFDLILPGFQTIETSIPLGGTSNHFKTKVLKELHGWDAFNVTEDCDLGIRLFKKGYKTAIIDSVTLEEANSNLKNWIRQRSRWIKGYMQTYLVHMRDPISFVKEHKEHSVLFNHVIGVRLVFMLVNPIMWLTTIAYFVLYAYVGPSIEALFPPVIYYMALTSIVFGNFLHLYNYMIGTAKRSHWSLIKYVFLMPVYWFFISISAIKAFYQLIFKPHFWEKTHHGLHLPTSHAGEKKVETIEVEEIEEVEVEKVKAVAGVDSKIKRVKLPSSMSKIIDRIGAEKTSGGLLVIATGLASFINYLYNAFLGRTLSLEEFGVISLAGNILFLVSIPYGTLGDSVAYKTAYYLGKHNTTIREFWSYVRRRVALIGGGLFLLWYMSIPFLNNFFNIDGYLPFILLSPIWIIGMVAACDGGYLTGNLKFFFVSVVLISEAFIKLLFAWVFVSTGNAQLVYASIPISMAAALLMGWYYAKNLKQDKNNIDKEELISFPTRFFSTSALIKFSAVSYLALDLILVKHYLNPAEAGQYALLALAGKMIFFIGGLFGQFLIPVISKHEGSGADSKSAFNKIFYASAAVSATFYIAIGLLGRFTAPLLFGPRVIPVVNLLPLYGLGMLGYTMARTIITYHQIKGKASFPVISVFITMAQVTLIGLFHASMAAVVLVMAITGVMGFNIVALVHYVLEKRSEKKVVEGPVRLAKRLPRVLIYNWRDIKHSWAGGAEVYVQELAKRMVDCGYDVTVFCGNDKKCSRHEVIDGVEIYRHGGFYTVYIWAFLYYVFKFRKNIDVIIDSENGVPFFTPLYSRKPVIGLIHHIHQDVFINNLSAPAAALATFLESTLMPIVYRNTKMITVSESSKDDMIKIGLGRSQAIEIIHPGVENKKFRAVKKTKDPTILYLGRLKPYKSVDTVINAMKLIIEKQPKTKLKIAGFGESREDLESLVKELNLENNVEFLGKISEEIKPKVLGESWVFVYPSMMEGWGISAIEASASGTPVVASNVPGLRESVKNPSTGILVEYGNVEAFADKISMLISNNKLRTIFGKQGIKWAENFSWDNSTDKLIEVIKKTLEIS